MDPIRIVASLAFVLGATTGNAQVLLHEDFNDNSAGWTFQDIGWAIGPAVASGCSVPGDPALDGDGKPGGGLAGTVIGGCLPDQPFWTEAFLVSPTVDASGASQLRLEFDHWLADFNSSVVVQVLYDSTWVTAWGFYPTIGWVHESIDITPWANPGLKVRFRFEYGWALLAGWSVDNVRITNREFFHDRFKGNSAGWSLGPQWSIGNATASVGCATDIGYFNDPSSDADGTPAGGVAGVVIGGCVGATPHGQYDFTSPPIDTSGANVLRLSFDRWLNSDFLGYMDSVVEVYNGASWVGIFTTCCTLIADSSWVHVTYDVTAHKNAAFRVRFGYDHNGAAYDVSSWNVDNVSVYDPSSCYLAISAYNGPGSIKVRAHCVTSSAPPGTILFNCFTLAAGAYPNGWFFGLDPTFNDIFGQFGSGAPPFVGISDIDGNFTWQLPAFVPAGLSLHGVSVALGGALNVVGYSAPVHFVTQ